MALDLARLTLAPSMRLYGVQVTYTRAGEDAFAVAGVFDRQHAESYNAEGVPVAVLRAQLGVRLAAFPAGIVPLQGDGVVVSFLGARPVDASTAGAATESFTVQDVQRDAEGGAQLILGGWEA